MTISAYRRRRTKRIWTRVLLRDAGVRYGYDLAGQAVVNENRLRTAVSIAAGARKRSRAKESNNVTIGADRWGIAVEIGNLDARCRRRIDEYWR